MVTKQGEMEALFAPDGPFSRAIDGFRPRQQQTRMAQAVAGALESRGRLVVEAGTGTGKTFAYLAPALLAGSKVIISTGTKNLQEQLYHRDLPTVRKALGAPVDVTLLKGRQNYLCPHRLEKAEGFAHKSRRTMAALAHTREWAGQTRSGDLAELGGLPDQAGIRAQITSTTDNCLGSECPQYSECFVVKARRRAQQADVVVVNHHLLLADMALREEGFCELLPGADAVILDEAHKLPATASSFFGQSVSARQISQLIRDVRAENEPFQNETRELEAELIELEQAVQALSLGMGSQRYRLSWAEWQGRQEQESALGAFRSALLSVATTLGTIAERSQGLGKCAQRIQAIQARLDLLAGVDHAETEETSQEELQPQIRWVENYPTGFAFHLTPLDVADNFRHALESHAASWIFTSATLGVRGDFSHFKARLGLAEDTETLALDSPFDFENNALLYLPEHLPWPNARGYTEAVAEHILPLLQQAGGGAFLLFTSYRALHQAEEYLRRNSDFTLLVQGETNRNELLTRFRASENSILLGTSSFWEGVDVRGSALRLVVIDRLPFSSPGDPVLKARLDALKARGMEPFTEFQLPEAVVSLKQGVGRLVRDRNDQGVLVICDPRLLRRGYGKLFLESLPAMSRTRNLEHTGSFLRAIRPEKTGNPA